MPSSFVTPLRYEPVIGKSRGGRQVYRITAPFVYDIGTLGSGVSVEVEAGFETDFASVPRLADDWFGLNPTGRHSKAVVIHDKLYSDPMLSAIIAELIFVEERAPLKVCGINMGKLYDKAKPRFAADLIMLEASGVLGVDLFTRHIHFLGVRIGGFKAFQSAQVKAFGAQSLKGDKYV
jgi:hypothetical protein